ncbi:hypothetical protein [Pseudonocardia sp. ICBG601]|uniref:hypothetical protein n=1 Tax=Pseudonocardia sp. ICBG601 TaxID=2846759 RepID=UPI001CF6B12D|nr:hypothetical protein [Pseudonocardia sp. ICBG601]
MGDRCGGYQRDHGGRDRCGDHGDTGGEDTSGDQKPGDLQDQEPADEESPGGRCLAWPGPPVSADAVSSGALVVW